MTGRKRREPGGLSDPRRLGGDIVGGDPHGRNTSVIDPRDCVLLDDVSVCAVEGRASGIQVGDLVFMVLSGRVNRGAVGDRARIGFLFDADGVAAIVSELLALADRGGGLDALVGRLTDLDQGGNVDLRRVQEAVGRAVARGEGDDDGDKGDR